MCHLILLMPLISLPVFWLWPIEVAAPVYAVVFAVSVWTYVFAVRAMHRPVETGREAMLQSRGEVVAVHERKLSVQIGAERWDAESRAALQLGDRVRVTAIEGIVLTVERDDREAPETSRGPAAEGGFERHAC